MVKQYLKSKYKTVMAFIFFVAVFILVAFLYDMPMGSWVYAILLCAFCGGIFMLYDFYRYSQKSRKLEDCRYRMQSGLDDLPAPTDRIEEDYQRMLFELYDKAAEMSSKMDSERSDTTEYYTLWVHQIKTPIAAMNLLLQEADFEQKSEIKLELFKIEQYVEMVLQYMRLGSEQTDFVFRRQALDPIIREAVKKYSAVFIKKKITLNYEPAEITAVTDEKWLGFVIEQVLSNALKYTDSGSITISSGKTDDGSFISISDTGIGIQPEDLPRVFEKGFTGYNGRNDKKSTGIGLNLCHDVIGKLGHKIEVESEVGFGTKVTISFYDISVRYE